jgi:hypothetical protein
MCEQCEGLSERSKIGSGRQYRELAAQLISMIGRKNLNLLSAQGGSLEEVATSKIWPSDVISHEFQCTKCAQKFSLYADTYHGHGEWSAEN